MPTGSSPEAPYSPDGVQLESFAASPSALTACRLSHLVTPHVPGPPCSADDVQLEFIMLNPYIRAPLRHDGQGTFSLQFKVRSNSCGSVTHT
jgi:hypothetical protein